MATCIKNFNIYWFGATLLLFWFFFIHAPPVLIQDHAKDRPLLCLHLCCAFSISVACIHNSLLTPSLFDGQAQPFHVWVGRVGLIAGIVSFCAGGYIAWFQQDDLGFATGITIGGLLQLNAARLGYGSIQRCLDRRSTLRLSGLIHTTRASGYLKVKKQLEGDKENGELKQQKDAALQDGWMQYMFS
ncbi:unnamed protein product [Durusdinium trenchii]|uniref:Cytochrome b561 domain-containing protein n=2 Tax=Durusdinium trenchii TaxID=1381693 RepID=A0ABP0N958_9DINO